MVEHDNPDEAVGVSTAGEVVRQLRIPADAAGSRADQALAALCPQWSRSQLTAWLRAGDIRVDGARVKPSVRLAGGEHVDMQVRLEPQVGPVAQPIEVDVCYRDADLLVVNKPAGLVVHPGAGNPDGTLLNGLLHLDPAQEMLPRAGIVHRLDKDTSGLMVVACSQRAHKNLVAMFSQHAVERRYLAVVKGVLIAGATVDAALGRHPRDRRRQAVVTHGGKRAITHYRVQERFAAHSLIACRLETGRTHQIRVHMAHIGHGLVGDPMYGGPPTLPRAADPGLVETLQGFRRQALHAGQLAFQHPVSGQAMHFEKPCPPDMQELVDALRKGAVDG